MANLVSAESIIGRKFKTFLDVEYLITQCDYREDSVYVWKNGNTQDTFNRGCWRKTTVVDYLNYGIWAII